LKQYDNIKRITSGCVIALLVSMSLPLEASAIQLHTSSEGIITHQVGHLFFLFSMVALIFTITGKGLNTQKGWRLIQYSAFFFIVWNLDVLAAHFLDNQMRLVEIENLSWDRIRINVQNGSVGLAWIYYFLKLDHLLCVPAMLLLYRGLSRLVKEQHEMPVTKDHP
jgi:hypothetical protein